MQFEKDRSAGYLVNHLARQFGIALADRLKPLDLAPAQFMVLLVLWRDPGVSQRQLTESLSVEQATMANTLGRMARDGLIERRPHPQDGRVQLIFPTPRAQALEAPATRAAAAVNAQALAGLSSAEVEDFLWLVGRIMANLHAHHPE